MLLNRKWILFLVAAAIGFALLALLLIRTSPRMPNHLEIARACLDLRSSLSPSQKTGVIVLERDDPRLDRVLRNLRPSNAFVTTNRVILLRHAHIGILSTESTRCSESEPLGLLKWVPLRCHRQLLIVTNR